MRGIAVFSFVLVVALIAGAAQAQSNYYVPSVNYNEMNHLRYPLATADSSEKNYKNRGTLGTNYNANGHKHVVAEKDSVRGWVTNFVPNEKKLGGYAEFVYPDIDSAKASLSFWIKPTSVEDMFIMSHGDMNAGFSLYTLEDDLIVRMTITGKNSETLTSTIRLNASEWNHVAITQGGADSQGKYYTALYINNTLAAVSTKGGFVTKGAKGYIGSAAKSGHVVNDNNTMNYVRNLDSTADIIGIRSFFSGMVSDVRFFATDELVCSDKTKSSYQTDNRLIKVNTQCSLKSDIMSLATNRIEPAGLIARFPYRRDIADHGPNKTDVSTNNTTAPGYVSDDLRLDKAVFDAAAPNLVSYGNENSGSESANLINRQAKGPFALSFWFQAKDASNEKVQMLYKAGSENEGGINVYIQKDHLYFGAWPNKDTKWFIKSNQATSNILGNMWHHVAVSYDPARLGADNATPAGMTAYLDGDIVGTVQMRAVAGQGGKYTTIGAKGPNSTRYYDGTSDQDKSGDNAFTGYLSEIKVYAFPLTKPQVQQLADRFADAYVPSYTKTSYGQLQVYDAYQKPGYTYLASKATVSNLGWGTGNQYDSVNITVTYDWSQPGVRWTDSYTGQTTQDCEYVMAGVTYYSTSLAGWDDYEPTGIYLCFSPGKIGNNIAPFTLALEYGQYANTLYMPVFDSLLPPKVLNSLKHFSNTRGVKNITTHFNINIGKYNVLLQARSTATDFYWDEPNYIGPLFLGGNQLVHQIFNQTTASSTAAILFVRPQNFAQYYHYSAKYVYQKELLDELDIKFSKDR